MLDFDILAAAFDRQSSLTIYCAVRRPSNDLEATVYPAWLIKDYGEPFEESLAESEDGSLEQVLLFSDCRNPDARQEVLNPWRYEAEKAGAEVIRRGLTANQAFLHSRTVEWILTCIQHVPWSKTDFIDQDEFDIGEGLVTTLRNAWVTSHQVCRQLANGNVPKREAAGHEPQVSVQDGDGLGPREPLTPNDRCILQAMLELNATALKPEIGPKIVRTALHRGDAKRAFERLIARRFVDSKEGRGGGYWLTQSGLKAAKTLLGIGATDSHTDCTD